MRLRTGDGHLKALLAVKGAMVVLLSTVVLVGTAL
jgi:hypothetical protein